MTETKPRHPDVFLQLIAAALTPIFSTATDGDQGRAQAAAIETINAYVPSYPSDLLPIAQIIAFGLAALRSISLSMAENIPIPLILRLRGNAASLSRGAEQCRRALAEPPPPDVDLYPAAEFAEAGRWIDEAVQAEIARARKPASGDRAAQPTIPRDDPPTMAAALDALAAESRRRIEEAEAALAAPSQHQAKPASRPCDRARGRQRCLGQRHGRHRPGIAGLPTTRRRHPRRRPGECRQPPHDRLPDVIAADLQNASHVRTGVAGRPLSTSEMTLFGPRVPTCREAPAYNEIFRNAPSSPMMPRRNASTQTMKITPCVTVTQAPNCAR